MNSDKTHRCKHCGKVLTIPATIRMVASATIRCANCRQQTFVDFKKDRRKPWWKFINIFGWLSRSEKTVPQSKKAIPHSEYVLKYKKYVAAADSDALDDLLHKNVKCGFCDEVVYGEDAAVNLKCPKCGKNWRR